MSAEKKIIIDPELRGIAVDLSVVQKGRVFRMLRELRDISQTELATRTGMSQPMVSQIERCQRLIPAERISVFATALGIDEGSLRIYLGTPVEEAPSEPLPQ